MAPPTPERAPRVLGGMSASPENEEVERTHGAGEISLDTIRQLSAMHPIEDSGGGDGGGGAFAEDDGDGMSGLGLGGLGAWGFSGRGSGGFGGGGGGDGDDSRSLVHGCHLSVSPPIRNSDGDSGSSPVERAGDGDDDSSGRDGNGGGGSGGGGMFSGGGWARGFSSVTQLASKSLTAVATSNFASKAVEAAKGMGKDWAELQSHIAGEERP